MVNIRGYARLEHALLKSPGMTAVINTELSPTTAAVAPLSPVNTVTPTATCPHSPTNRGRNAAT
jgi:hypothetical protein